MSEILRLLGPENLKGPKRRDMTSDEVMSRWLSISRCCDARRRALSWRSMWLMMMTMKGLRRHRVYGTCEFMLHFTMSREDVYIYIYIAIHTIHATWVPLVLPAMQQTNTTTNNQSRNQPTKQPKINRNNKKRTTNQPKWFIVIQPAAHKKLRFSSETFTCSTYFIRICALAKLLQRDPN